MSAERCLATKAEGRAGTVAGDRVLPKCMHFRVTKSNILSVSRIWVSVMYYRMGEPAIACDHDLAPLSPLRFTVLSCQVVCVHIYVESLACVPKPQLPNGDTLTHRKGSHRNEWTQA